MVAYEIVKDMIDDLGNNMDLPTVLLALSCRLAHTANQMNNESNTGVKQSTINMSPFFDQRGNQLSFTMTHSIEISPLRFNSKNLNLGYHMANEGLIDSSPPGTRLQNHHISHYPHPRNTDLVSIYGTSTHSIKWSN